MKKYLTLLAVTFVIGLTAVSCTDDVLGDDNIEISKDTVLTGDDTSSDIDTDRDE